MSKFRYGLASLKVSDIDPATGLALAGSVKELKEDVYRDSFDFIEEEGTDTDHFSESDVDPKISFNERGKLKLTLQIMDTSVDTLALLMGGNVVDVVGVKTWSRPAMNIQKEKYVEIETADGYKMVVARGSLSARYNNQVRRNGIALINVTITPLTPQVGGLATLDIIEPAP